MTDDFAEIERIAGALLKSLSSAERRRLLRTIARDLQRSQSARIARQQNPDGTPYAPRKKKQPPSPGRYAVKFLYPKGAAEPRVVLMKSWVHEGPLLTGYDVEAGGIRSFFWDKVDRWLPVMPEEQNKSAGKFRRNGQLRRKAMFRKLHTARNLKAGASDREAWIGFTGRAAEIARVSQEGGTDRPAAKARPVQYARRSLLGLDERDRGRVLDMLFAHIGAES